MDIFDFAKILFKNNGEYEKLSNGDKKNCFFMINRYMSKKYPIQANAFNHFKIDPVSVLDYWHFKMNRDTNGSYPKWMYASGSASKKEDKIKKPSEKSIDVFLKKRGYTRKQLDQAVLIFGKEAYDPIFKMEKILKDNI